ncbi:hypothetical protein GGTG_02502 [Gaeumannomyces tritici R3-111a-1]|uniref:Uncharacterized protein n=1 Tax=Gaeumannomyces tritici (strain R3-111a-1) TaxID=644352 RepID=J3NMJ6_GAET3|nr:hypothetical protein GGTG_02502 [Gaeumannomyces tritici R3-111a-1]EJT82529.1 hypothetical protein GGTG_02502 [Gaeumannomyces tritici R3-111a-1]
MPLGPYWNNITLRGRSPTTFRLSRHRHTTPSQRPYIPFMYISKDASVKAFPKAGVNNGYEL